MSRRDPRTYAESILNEAPPWVELNPILTLEYGLLGGDSPFANWVSGEELEDFPTPESLFLSPQLGNNIKDWSQRRRHFEIDRTNEKYPPMDLSGEIGDWFREGLCLCEDIRREIPYYFVVPGFLKMLPPAARAQLSESNLETRSLRSMDMQTPNFGANRIDMVPFKHLIDDTKRDTMPGIIELQTRNLRLHNWPIDTNLQASLELWRAQWIENFEGFPLNRGGDVRWDPHFDRHAWLLRGFDLAREVNRHVPDASVVCVAAKFALSKHEWEECLKQLEFT